MKDKILKLLNDNSDYFQPNGYSGMTYIEEKQFPKLTDEIIEAVIKEYDRLPEDCIEEWDDMKFCAWGRRCKQCVNIDNKYIEEE